MAWMSTEAVRLAGGDVLDSVTDADLTPDLPDVTARSWTVLDDVLVLRSRYESYLGDRGDRPAFVYESAVNGRGIYDLDLVDRSATSVPILLRRGLAFAWAALHHANHELPGNSLAAYVSVAPMADLDGSALVWNTDHYTANGTFVTRRPGQPPYIDPQTVGDYVIVELLAEDCAQPFPPANVTTAR
jgi:hypothetical protein